MSTQVLQNSYALDFESLQQHLAPYLLGLTVSSPLYAISIYQGARYFSTYGSDPRYLKYLVAILLFLGSSRSAFLAHAVFMSFTSLHDRIRLNQPSTCHGQITLMLAEILGALLTCLVQSAYIWRIFHLSHRNIALVGILVLFTLCQFGAWLAVVVGLILDAPGQGLGLCSFGGPFSGSAVSPNLNITIEAFRYAELSASIISDVLITVSMVYYLRIGIYETNLFGTRSIVRRLIDYITAIGLNACILSIVALVLFAARSFQKYLVLIQFIIPNVYVCSFLASLNWRMGLRAVGRSPDLLSTQSHFEFAMPDFATETRERQLQLCIIFTTILKRSIRRHRRYLIVMALRLTSACVLDMAVPRSTCENSKLN
ncbi:hypothetical protein AB1N83_002084 [Pleurotus pulmonarius]